jgi:hypothetical protein
VKRCSGGAGKSPMPRRIEEDCVLNNVRRGKFSTEPSCTDFSCSGLSANLLMVQRQIARRGTPTKNGTHHPQEVICDSDRRLDIAPTQMAASAKPPGRAHYPDRCIRLPIRSAGRVTVEPVPPTERSRCETDRGVEPAGSPPWWGISELVRPQAQVTARQREIRCR